jgi:uncharacterized protein
MRDRAMATTARGLASPLEIDHRGGLRLSSGVDRLEARIGAVVATMPGERVMRPALGCDVWRLLAQKPGAGPSTDAATEVRRTLERDEPGLVVRDVRAHVREETAEAPVVFVFGADPAERVPSVVLDVEIDCTEPEAADPVTVTVGLRLVLVYGQAVAVPGPGHRDMAFLWRTWEAD